MRRLYVLLTLVACTEESQIDEGSVPEFSQRLVGMRIENYTGSELLWVLEADTSYDVGNFYRVYNFVLMFYEDGKVSSRIVADSGLMDKRSRNMVALGNVHVETAESIYMDTNILMWNEMERKIHTEDTVFIKWKDKELVGIGFESDPNLRRIVIKRNVHGKGREGIVR